MSIASRISSMEGHISDAYDEIQRLGIDLTNTDKNLQNMSTKLEDGLTIVTTVKGSGTSITLDGTKYGALTLIPLGACRQTGNPSPSNKVDVMPVRWSANIRVQNNDVSDPKEQFYEIRWGDIILNGLGTYHDRVIGEKDNWQIERNIIVADMYLKFQDITEYESAALSNNFYECGPSLTNINEASKNLILSDYFRNVFFITEEDGNNGMALTDSAKLRIRDIGAFSGVSSVENFFYTNHPKLYYIAAEPTLEPVQDATLISDLNAIYDAVGYDGQTVIRVTSVTGSELLTVEAIGMNSNSTFANKYEIIHRDSIPQEAVSDVLNENY